MVILENIDIDIDIDKAILQNIDIDKISNRFKFGISNRASPWSPQLRPTTFKYATNCLEWQFANKIVKNNNLQQVCLETITCQIYKKNRNNMQNL